MCWQIHKSSCWCFLTSSLAGWGWCSRLCALQSTDIRWCRGWCRGRWRCPSPRTEPGWSSEAGASCSPGEEPADPETQTKRFNDIWALEVIVQRSSRCPCECFILKCHFLSGCDVLIFNDGRYNEREICADISDKDSGFLSLFLTLKCNLFSSLSLLLPTASIELWIIYCTLKHVQHMFVFNFTDAKEPKTPDKTGWNVICVGKQAVKFWQKAGSTRRSHTTPIPSKAKMAVPKKRG